MNMYQKREMRKNKKMNEDTKSLTSTNINWYPGHMAKTKKTNNTRPKNSRHSNRTIRCKNTSIKSKSKHSRNNKK